MWIFILFLCSFSISYAQFSDHIIQNNDEIVRIRKNKIKSCSIIEETYENDKLTGNYMQEYLEYDTKGRLVLEKFYFDAEKKEYDLIQYEYNQEGKIIKESWKEFPETDISFSGEEHYYYENGRLIKKCLHENGLPKDECTYYMYEKEKLVLEVDSMSKKTKYEYKNDSIFAIDLNNEGHYMKYDKNYRLIEWASKDVIFKYEFNKDGTLSKSYSIKKGKLTLENEFKYKNGICIEAVFSDPESKIKKVDRYIYTYYK